MQLRGILERAHSRAYVTCFWRGDAGETAPPIPARFTSAAKRVAADIETDYSAGD